MYNLYERHFFVSYMSNTPTQQRITDIITQHPVVLFMKGTATFPACGFSALAVQLLKTHGVQAFTVNVLEDAEIRQGIKDYSQWPTIPQIYVQQNFIGGSDILKNLHDSGELATLLAPVLAQSTQKD